MEVKDVRHTQAVIPLSIQDSAVAMIHNSPGEGLGWERSKQMQETMQAFAYLPARRPCLSRAE